MRQRDVKNLDDDIIIDKVLRGQRELYNQLIERHKSYAFTIALNILNNREDAEEVAHDSFIKAYQSLTNFNRQSKFSTWLYRIVFNTAITCKRKQRVKKESLDTVKYTYYEGSSAEMEIQDQKRFIKQALSLLPEIDRSILTLFYLKEFSLEEIADITKMSFNTAKVRLHRARKKLADGMKTILKEEALNL
ncbi:RNA polymerase sigma factor [Fulvivirga sp. 29W222]|uniref:RNA polymerase sigma factor n=1 Tax=Fulvivirga marina TaxID=2494733 RepID=A0A937FUZ6_9BACT|nr:RNA polymerase sigma factor [Fulvivirga marina]MBL6444923.1 RNA polymerase sigma factor [Fulvivirga marina]